MKIEKYPDAEQSHRFEDTYLEVKQSVHNNETIIINVKIDNKNNFHLLTKDSALDLAAYILRAYCVEVNF